MYYEYHIQTFNKSSQWEGDRISGNCRKRNDEKWLKFLKHANTRMVLYVKDEDKELQDIITLKTI
jgi:ribosome biogenesis protein Nip4